MGRKKLDKDHMLECIRQIKAKEAARKKLDDEISVCKYEIKNAMETYGLSEMQCDIFTVRYTEIAAAKLDTEALKKNLPDVYSRFCKPSSYKKLTIN